MIEGLFNQTNYVAAKKMLDVTALRHEAIASNLANLETPHYKRMDVAPAFASELRQDGNNVQLETELLKLNQNFLEHQLETQLVSGAMMKLRLAITGRS